MTTLRSRRNLVIVPILALGILLAAGCKKKKGAGSPDKPWPDRPMKRVSATKKGITFSILLPEGIGAYQDPNGTIWRIVNPDMAVFVKIFLVEMPKDQKTAGEEPSMAPGEKLLTNEKTADGFFVVVHNTKDGRKRYFLWKKAGTGAVQCYAFYKLSKMSKDKASKYNAWLLRICKSLKLSSG
jgi:hypothetical protein